MIKMRLHILMAERDRITQQELSKITKIRQATISAYCNNTFKTINKDHLNVLCKFFNCKISDLIQYFPD